MIIAADFAFHFLYIIERFFVGSLFYFFIFLSNITVIKCKKVTLRCDFSDLFVTFSEVRFKQNYKDTQKLSKKLRFGNAFIV